MIPGAIADCVLDFFMMTAAVFLLGFDKLFLPSLFVEAIPEIDAFPTWTGCVAFVIWKRRKAEDSGAAPLEAIQETKIKPAVAAIELTPAPLLITEPRSYNPVEAKLLNLRNLFDKGLISQAELEAKRHQILSEI